MKNTSTYSEKTSQNSNSNINIYIENEQINIDIDPENVPKTFTKIYVQRLLENVEEGALQKTFESVGNFTFNHSR